MTSSERGLVRKTRILAAIVILSNALGNFSLSRGMRSEAFEPSLSPLLYVQAIFRPWVLLGITLLIFWMLSRMTLLSWADLTYVLPVTSLGYVLSALIGRYFLGEQVSWQRWAGTFLIVAGTALVGATTPRTTPVREILGNDQ